MILKKKTEVIRQYSNNFEFTLKATEVKKYYFFKLLIFEKERVTVNNNDNSLFVKGKTIGFANNEKSD